MRAFDPLDPIGPVHLSAPRVVPPLLAAITSHLIGAIQPTHFSSNIRTAILSAVFLTQSTILLP
ncbi:MAG: hypothetical protein AAB658_07085 [Chloroflexota bacterium]